VLLATSCRWALRFGLNTEMNFYESEEKTRVNVAIYDESTPGILPLDFKQSDSKYAIYDISHEKLKAVISPGSFTWKISVYSPRTGTWDVTRTIKIDIGQVMKEKYHRQHMEEFILKSQEEDYEIKFYSAFMDSHGREQEYDPGKENWYKHSFFQILSYAKIRIIE
jgi:hypothetical protein